jgi:hypothetical protein
MRTCSCCAMNAMLATTPSACSRRWIVSPREIGSAHDVNHASIAHEAVAAAATLSRRPLERTRLLLQRGVGHLVNRTLVGGGRDWWTMLTRMTTPTAFW